MTFNIRALTIVCAVLWGGLFLLVGIANQIWESYGAGLLQLGASVYPGYDGPAGFGSVIVVTLYALVDGAICGALFGWIYNTVAGKGAVA